MEKQGECKGLISLLFALTSAMRKGRNDLVELRVQYLIKLPSFTYLVG